MITVRATDRRSWQEHARKLLAANVPPRDVFWAAETAPLFADEPLADSDSNITVPAEFLNLVKTVALHSDDVRWSLLYRVLYRLTHGERSLLKIDVDEDVRQLNLMAKAVQRDMHKMTAFVRFRKVNEGTTERFVAWYRPDHHIVEAIAPWFARRFGSMVWSILTPECSAHWDLAKLTFTAGVPRTQAPQGDALEELWRTYYASIFNPARVNLKAMQAEMPMRHWATLPEAEVISSLVAKANGRVTEMAKAQKGSAAEWVPKTHSIQVLKAAAPTCQGCELYTRATQVVFGEGPKDARVVMVGEQPGDEEDLQGHPFVGPSGRLLNKAMEEAGVDRKQVYVTNAVKHFKWIERGKRRIHAKPNGFEISACRPWLEAELAALKPKLVVCLGATAAQSLMGREFRVTSERGVFFPHRWAKELVATVHPSAILRAADRYKEEYELFVHDLKLVADRLQQMA